MATAPGAEECDAGVVAREDSFGGFQTEIFPNGCDSKFKCNFCDLILRDPLQGYCGHRFCKSCIKHVHQLSQSQKSPVKCKTCLADGTTDEELIELNPEQMFPDNAVKREMANVHVICVNSPCDWKGQFKNYTKHHVECPHAPVHCECAMMVPKSGLAEHKVTECVLRSIACKYCNQQIQLRSREDHNKSCPKFPLKCDDCGKKKVPRDKMQDHLEKECANPRLTCPFGCPEPVEKSRLDQHMKTNTNLHLQALGQKMNAIDQEIRNGLSSGVVRSFEAAFLELRQQVRALEEELRRVISNQKGGGALGATGGGDSPGGGERMRHYEEIVAVLHMENQKCIAAVQTMEHQRQSDRQLLDTYEQKIRTLERVVALKEVIISEMDLRLLSVELANYEGKLCWKISDFSRKRQDAITGKTTSIYSPAFYTDRMGYKMCARLYPNGDGMGKGSHLSLFFVLMRGHYDALLKFPFKQKVTLMLLDQSSRDCPSDVVDTFRPDPTSSSFKRPTTEMNIASGCPLFMPLQQLDGTVGKYIKDDTIFVRVVIDPSTPTVSHTATHPAPPPAPHK